MLRNPYSGHYFECPNPRAPYNGDIPGGLVPGKQIFVSGHVSHHATDFKIDLETSHGVALHINPRFHQGAVVRNTKVHGGWGPEERQGPLPFQRGQHFEVIIAVEPDRYKIAVNGHHCFDYRHREPISAVNRIHVHGDLELHQIIFSGGHGGQRNEVHPPASPFSIPLHHPHPGHMIQIQGHTHHHTGRFNVALQNGPGVEPNDIALQFSVRFDDPYVGQVVVRNNRRGGGWGNEERDGSFPFAKGQPFEILMLMEHGEWKVAVNGRHFASFAHRNPVHDANHLGVDGDVTITAVREF